MSKQLEIFWDSKYTSIAEQIEENLIKPSHKQSD